MRQFFSYWLFASGGRYRTRPNIQVNFNCGALWFKPEDVLWTWSHARCLADFITNTLAFRFSVHTHISIAFARQIVDGSENFVGAGKQEP
jgi:hypothetical protein